MTTLRFIKCKPTEHPILSDAEDGLASALPRDEVLLADEKGTSAKDSQLKCPFRWLKMLQKCACKIGASSTKMEELRWKKGIGRNNK